MEEALIKLKYGKMFVIGIPSFAAIMPKYTSSKERNFTKGDAK